MSRPRAITAVTLLHVAYAIVIAAMAVYCVVLARAEAAKKGYGGRALLIGAIGMAVFALLYAIAARGLWRVRRWGWVLALVIDALIPVLVLWDIFIDHDRDPDNWIAIAIFAVPVVVLLLPAVRRPFSRLATAAAATPH